MHLSRTLWLRSIALVAGLALLSGCGLPRGGPTKKELFESSVQRSGNAFVVQVDQRVARASAVDPGLGFSPTLVNAGMLGSDTVRAGDTLGLTIYENVDDGLLVPEGTPSAVLEEVQVDGDGYIFVPYAGRIRAAGNSPEAIRRIISGRLDSQTPDPQVQVRRLQGDGATVSVTGGVGASGIYPIERPTRTLSAMISRAGGLTVPNDVAQISLIRDGRTERIWFDDLYRNPRLDIPLRGGDRVLVEQDRRSFTALGATGSQQLVPFDRQSISAIEAIAQVGGLSSALADPTGVFVLRDESEAVARQVMGRADLQGMHRMAYVLDLTTPNGMFDARDFDIRDGDTVYVTEAPYVQWQKTLSALTGTAGAANGLNNLAGGS